LDLTKDFDGDAIITRRTSSSVTGWKTSFIAMAETRVRWRDTISGNTDVIDLLAEVLSKAVSSQKCRTLATGLVTTKQIGGGIPSVATRMSSTFLLKYLAKPSAVRNVEHWPLDLSRPSRL